MFLRLRLWPGRASTCLNYLSLGREELHDAKGMRVFQRVGAPKTGHELILVQMDLEQLIWNWKSESNSHSH